MGVCGISHRFQWLSPTPGQIPTRYSPVRRCPPSEDGFSLDLHVLGLPPAFVLSQDQTLTLLSAQGILQKEVCLTRHKSRPSILKLASDARTKAYQSTNGPITPTAHPFLKYTLSKNRPLNDCAAGGQTAQIAIRRPWCGRGLYDRSEVLSNEC